jgi:hypothetical protein
MQNEEIKINISSDRDRVIILTGEAPKNIRSKVVNIEGALDAPAVFYEARKKISEPEEPQFIDKNTAIVTAKRLDGVIILMLNPHTIDGTQINVKGSLVEDKDLAKCGVFYGSTKPNIYGRQEFVKFLKFNRMFFKLGEGFDKLLAELTKLEMKIDQAINETKDDRGQFDTAVSRSIKTGLPETVKMKVKIFNGFPEVEFEADVCFDIEDRRPVFWLESAQLGEIIETTKGQLIDDVLKELEGLTIIELN